MSTMIDIDLVQDIPGYQFIMKALLRSQILNLVDQLSQYTGEETVVMTVSVSDGTFCHLGSSDAKDFLEGREEVKSQFLKHCIKKNMLKKAKEKQKNKSETNFQDMPPPRLTDQTTTTAVSVAHPTPVRLLKNTAVKDATSPEFLQPETSVLSSPKMKSILPAKQSVVHKPSISPTVQTKFSIDMKKFSAATSGEKRQSQSVTIPENVFTRFKAAIANEKEEKENAWKRQKKRISEFVQESNVSEPMTKKQKRSQGNESVDERMETMVTVFADAGSVEEEGSEVVDEITDNDNEAENPESGSSKMTVFVEDTEEGANDVEKVISPPGKAGLRKNRKMNGFLQMNSADCASEEEINAAIGGKSKSGKKQDEEQMRIRGTTYRGVTRWFLVPKNSSTNPKRRLTNKTLALKMQVLQEVRKGEMRKSEIARRYNLPSSTLSTWVKTADKIEQGYKMFDKKRKMCRTGKWEQIENYLLDWFLKARETGEPLSGLLLIKKAREFAIELNVTDFNGSPGWLDRFKHRHGITFRNAGPASLSNTDGTSRSELLPDGEGEEFMEPEWEVVNDESGQVKLNNMMVDNVPQSDVEEIMSAMADYKPSEDIPECVTIKVEPLEIEEG